MGKTSGSDCIMAKHVKHAGLPLVNVLFLVFKAILDTEYIPISFRRGIQVPLYKGKDTSTLDVNNYRGITLLNTFNKLFEALLWNRMKTCWDENAVVSRLQGACRTGVSCIHTAMTLQETITSALETTEKVYVLYLDVVKAFDSIWMNGLFYRLCELVIRGMTWRLLFKTYLDFKRCARIQNKLSEWYHMRAGIRVDTFH